MKPVFQAIIDTEAYSRYDLPTTHRDRMIYHYLPDIKEYGSSRFPLAFFSYIAGGFSSTIANHIQEISNSSSINGSAVPVTIFIKMVEQQSQNLYSHAELKNIFSLNRMITINDLKDF